MAQGRDSHTQLYFGLLVFMNSTEGREVGGGHGGTQTLQSEENIDFGFLYQEMYEKILRLAVMASVELQGSASAH